MVKKVLKIGNSMLAILLEFSRHQCSHQYDLLMFCCDFRDVWWLVEDVALVMVTRKLGQRL